MTTRRDIPLAQIDRLLSLFVACLTCICLVACHKELPATGSAKATLDERILATTEPSAYLARRLVGDSVAVERIVSADADPAAWRPTTNDVRAMQRARLVVMNGAELEHWSRQFALPRSRTVYLTPEAGPDLLMLPTVTHSHGIGGEHSHDLPNPFVWLDPDLLEAQAEALIGAIRRVDSELATEEAVAALRADLTSLRDAYVQAAAAIGPSQVMTDDHRLAYLVRALNHEARPEGGPPLRLIVESGETAQSGDVRVSLAMEPGADLVEILRANLQTIEEAAQEAGSDG